MKARILMFVSVWVALSDCCQAPKHHSLASVVATKACGGDFQQPNFRTPVLCSQKDVVVDDLAYSIANSAFECENWCVFSLTSPGEAWLWNSAGLCWASNPATCFTHADEANRARKIANSLCKDCQTFVPPLALSLHQVQKKCKDATMLSSPALHVNVECHTKAPSEHLAVSLLNGGALECDSTCVYSLHHPSQFWWGWVEESRCWNRSHPGCNHADESSKNSSHPNWDAVKQAWQTLCEKPCEEPIDESQLSVDELRKICPQYNPAGAPQRHHARICGKPAQDKDLRTALVNGMFSTCSAWCVYSLTYSNVAWEWVDAGECWKKSNSCTELAKEVDEVAKKRERLCLPPPSKFEYFDRRRQLVKQQEVPLPKRPGQAHPISGHRNANSGSSSEYLTFTILLVCSASLLLAVVVKDPEFR